MSKDTTPLEPVPEPPSSSQLTNEQILLGPRHDPLMIITTYSAEEWENFIREWVSNLRSRYADVRRAAGAGDKGRDIVAFDGHIGEQGPWDNYQCKHYNDPLTPGDVWPELAKLCYYTFTGEYSVPRSYFFVAPKSVGPTLLRLLENPNKLKAGLVQEWKKGTLLKTGKDYIALEGVLAEYVEKFDFSIVRDIPPDKIIEEHRQTRFHAARFGGGLVKLPNMAIDPPGDIAPNETR